MKIYLQFLAATILVLILSNAASAQISSGSFKFPTTTTTASTGSTSFQFPSVPWDQISKAFADTTAFQQGSYTGTQGVSAACQQALQPYVTAIQAALTDPAKANFSTLCTQATQDTNLVTACGSNLSQTQVQQILSTCTTLSKTLQSLAQQLSSLKLNLGTTTLPATH